MQPTMEVSDKTPPMAVMEIEGSNTSFGSHISTPSTKFNGACIVTSTLEKHNPAVDLVMSVETSTISEKLLMTTIDIDVS